MKIAVLEIQAYTVRVVPRYVILPLLGVGKIKAMRMPKHKILQNKFNYLVLNP